MNNVQLLCRAMVEASAPVSCRIIATADDNPAKCMLVKKLSVVTKTLCSLCHVGYLKLQGEVFFIVRAKN